MEKIDLSCWEEFEAKLKEHDFFNIAKKIMSKPIIVAPFWFRGQANAEWELRTTLERASGQDFSLEAYYNVILKGILQNRHRSWC